jgi:hypothetical protein
MLMTRLQLPARDALARRRGYAYAYAYAENTDIDQLAVALVDGSLDIDRMEA